MIGKFKILISLGLFLFFSVPSSHGESSNCLMVYKEGGAPAVFQSPKCPRWSLSTEDLRKRRENCQSAMLQGRRRYQEDRLLCALDIRIPFPGNARIKEVKVGVVAVFDGHNGAEASEMASKLLLEYFFLHVYFLLDGIYSFALEESAGMLMFNGDSESFSKLFNRDEACNQHCLDIGRLKWTLPEIFSESFHMEILKESLLRAVHDIDATFSKEAFRKNLDSGSTATIVLMVDGQILVANIGDSKALLCSETFWSRQEDKYALLKLYRQRRRNGFISPVKKWRNIELVASSNAAKHFAVKELTKDHHPDRADERSRVEAAGGYVFEWGGVPRVNGELAVSRAIGDVSFKSYGVTSAPEVTDWQPLIANDSYLVVASDGIFEKQTTQDVCDLLFDVHTEGNENSKLFSSCVHSLAECIVTTAFEKGSMDNMAAIVVPLRLTGFFGVLNETSEGDAPFGSPVSRLHKFSSSKSANSLAYSLLPVDYTSQAIDNFNKLLVEGKHGRLGFFYLYESLSENMDYVIESQKDDLEEEMYNLPWALPGAAGHHHSGLLPLYHNRDLCLTFGTDDEGDSRQCINPELFSRFLGLLESIPFFDSSGNSSESFEYAMPNLRYVLRRRFGRGSYGEVWLAFHWNCSQGGNAVTWVDKYKNCSFNRTRLDMHEFDSKLQNNSSPQYHTDASSDAFFILKRMMVERGPAVYLSGLREKHFGEVFLNASMSLGTPSEGFSYSFSESQFNYYNPLNSIKSSDSKTDYMRMHLKEEGLKHIARYVESFESQSKDIWLVFQNEGISLSKLLYTTEGAGTNTEKGKNEHIQVLQPSAWWHWLRATEAGKKEMRNLIWQLLVALKSCHDRNITHRDIKPENMVICFEDKSTGRCWKGSPIGDKQYTLNMRIIDFGSGIDEFTIKHLYGSSGPSRSEQTYEYTPPEALLNSKWFEGPKSIALKYDMWSVGVVMLELILGSPHVFQINARTQALLDQHLDGWSEATKELAYKLRSFMELCILIPGSSSKRHQSGNARDQIRTCLASWKCSEESFSDYVKRRDPLKIGFPNVWALRLVRQLLTWDPEDRLSVDDALKHPYFQNPPQT